MHPSSTFASRRVPRLLITLAVINLVVLVVLPFAGIIATALSEGFKTYLTIFKDHETLHALRLSLMLVALALPVHIVFGVMLAWALARCQFYGKRFVLTLIDLPFSISPVVAGLLFILVFGRNGWLGPFLTERNIAVIYATPGLLLATLFVTFPFIVRELLPLFESGLREEEEAAFLLGASSWTTFRRITLPDIKWGLLYGILLCNARAMGEFGAVSVVSGHIRGKTDTLPLHIEALFSDYNLVAANAVASLLALLGLLTLILRALIEWHVNKTRRNALHHSTLPSS